MVKGWKKVKIGSIVEILNGGTPATTKREYWNGGIKWCTPSDLTKQKCKYLCDTEKTITEKGLKESSATLLPKGAILLCSRATIGEMSIATAPIATNQGFKNLICKPGVYNEFLYYALFPIRPQMVELAIGTTFLEISKTALQTIEINIPETYREQTAIAEALSDIDSLISSMQKLIEKKKAVKQGAMQELLKGKKRLPGFCQRWVQKYLKEIIAPRKERVSPSEIDNRRCIELEHIKPNSGEILGYCDSKLQKSIKTVFYSNDILWGKLRPYLRKYAHPQFSGVCSTEFWVFNAVNKYSCNDFMYYLLQTEEFVSAANSTTGTKMPRADWNLVQELEIKIPSDKNEQQAIAHVLSDMDSEIKQLEKKLAKYQQIKQGMMQELLTGRIRLV